MQNNNIKFKFAISGLIILILLSLYSYNFLPFRKNILLNKALRTSFVNPALAFSYFEKALNFYSPIGQEETVKFFLNFFYNTLKSMPKEKIDKEKIKQIVLMANEIYQTNERKNPSVGINALFNLGLINIWAYQATNDQEILVLAEETITQARKRAPTRIILLKLEKELAQITKDEQREKMVSEKIKFLRPDLTIRNNE